jgi:branched-chain amino acid transport system permease protein
MAFFLETLFGGLMAGMLYSLVAIGFVLIFKASGVFNFSQGAMVLFAALAMARFSEWIPQWLGLGPDNLFISSLLAFAVAAVIMFGVAWLIERLVLRHLVNQEGTTLLMATLGITYVLDGAGQTIFGSDIYQINIGMPKDPIFILDPDLPRRHPDQQGRPDCSRHRCCIGRGPVVVLPENQHRPCSARRG